MPESPNIPASACLLQMPCGHKLRVDDLRGSPSLLARLYALGILPGTELELCKPAEECGSVCIRVRQSSLVLDASVAEGIYCHKSSLRGDECCPCACGLRQLDN